MWVKRGFSTPPHLLIKNKTMDIEKLQMKYLSHVGGQEIIIYITAQNLGDGYLRYYHPITGDFVKQRV